MDFSLILLRLLHIGLGVFWVGAIVFNTLFLVPAIRDAGPDGAKVAAGLMKRRFMDITPVVAIVTIISGLWLYWRASGGFQPAYVHSPMGGALAVGGLLAIVGFAVGIAVMRPSMLKAAALARGAASSADKESVMEEAQRLRLRAQGAGRWVAALLSLSVAAMAVARYL